MCTDTKVGGGLPTPVKEKVSRIEKSLLQGNPSPQGARKRRTRAHQPDPGQERIDKFFQKLAKAEAIKNKGVSNDPLLGVSGHSATLTPSKEGTGLVTEESGGCKEPAGKKRTIKVLERWPHLPADIKSGSGMSSGEQRRAGGHESPSRKGRKKGCTPRKQ